MYGLNELFRNGSLMISRNGMITYPVRRASLDVLSLGTNGPLLNKSYSKLIEINNAPVFSNKLDIKSFVILKANSPNPTTAIIIGIVLLRFASLQNSITAIMRKTPKRNEKLTGE
jgi:hypothetical protein